MALDQRNLRILNLSNSRGGQEKYVQLLADELIARNWHIQFSGGPESLIEDLEAAGAQVVNVEIFGYSDESVVLLNGNRALYASLFRGKGTAPWVYVQHSSFDDKQAGWVRRMVRRFLLRLSLLRVDLVIRVCENALPSGWARRGVSTVHNGVNLSKFPMKKGCLLASDRTSTLLMVGSINANKGQELAIRTLSLLTDCRLVLVGDGAIRSELEELAEELGVGQRVSWVDSQKDPSKFYREADLYLMLSEFEAMPFVVLESMASGTPVLGFPVGGVGEVIENGVDGILIEERTPEALSVAIDSLLKHPTQLKRMGLKARTKVEASFTDKHMVDALEHLISDLCGGNVETRG